MNNKPHRARKRFGQNFLQDQAVINRILAAATAGLSKQSDQHLVEIGPGQGALTYPLIDELKHTPNRRLTIIELDRDLAETLRKHIAGNDQVALIEADALNLSFTTLGQQQGAASLTTFGNLPYNISTPLIFHLLEQQQAFSAQENRTLFGSMTFMLQKEVVDRLCAEPNSKAYGRISVMAQLHCHTEKLFDVPPTAFNPQPKVTSSIVKLSPRSDKLETVQDLPLLTEVVKQSFAQRRKTLRNNLAKLISADELESINIAPSRRAETLTLDEYIALGNYLSDSSR